MFVSGGGCYSTQCDLEDVTLGEEWTVLLVNFRLSFCIIATHDGARVHENPMTLIAEVHLLIKNSTEMGIII